MSEVALQEILENTFTKQDFYARLGLVKECLEKVLFTEGVDDTSRAQLCADFARQNGREDMAPYMEEWGGEVFDIFTASDFYKQIEELKEQAESLPELVLYTPILLENAEVEEIGRWSRNEFDSKVIINLSVDPKVLGGCAFVWQGRHHDFSLNYFLEKKSNEIREIIKEYEYR